MDFDVKALRVTYLDIETDSRGGFPNLKTADKAVTAITISDGITYYSWALKGFIPHNEDIVYVECTSEKEMLMKFIRKWRELDADIVTGWNVDGFDIPYLYQRIANEINEEEAKKMSPWNMTEFRTYYDKMGREQNIVELVGLPVLDYIQLYQKFTYIKQEQYSLDYISQVELGEKKVDYRELGYTNLDDLYQRNHQQVIDFMQANPFVTICGVDANGLPVATHIPVLIKIHNEVITLSGHIMRKQDHSNAFEVNQNVLVIFSAPSAFVSANWYTTKDMGSTWNYQTVHARGQLEIKDQTHLRKLLTDLTLHFEKDADAPTQVKNLSKEYMEQNMKAIYSFDIVVNDLQHVFKLSQNRDEASHTNIQNELNKGDAACKYMAAAMKAELNPKDSHKNP